MPTFNQTVTVDNNDGFENTSADTWDDAYIILKVGRSGTGLNWNGAFRFTGVTVGQGDTINSATLTVDGASIGGSPGTTSVFGDDVDDAPAMSDTSRPETGWTDTTASGTFTPAVGTNVITITSVVQEIVDRGGWVSGQDMRFTIRDPYTGFGNVMTFDDSDGGADPAILDIDHDAAGGRPPLQRHRTVATGRASFY